MELSATAGVVGNRAPLPDGEREPVGAGRADGGPLPPPPEPAPGGVGGGGLRPGPVSGPGQGGRVPDAADGGRPPAHGGDGTPVTDPCNPCPPCSDGSCRCPKGYKEVDTNPPPEKGAPGGDGHDPGPGDGDSTPPGPGEAEPPALGRIQAMVHANLRAGGAPSLSGGGSVLDAGGGMALPVGGAEIRGMNSAVPAPPGTDGIPGGAGVRASGALTASTAPYAGVLGTGFALPSGGNAVGPSAGQGAVQAQSLLGGATAASSAPGIPMAVPGGLLGGRGTIDLPRSPVAAAMAAAAGGTGFPWGSLESGPHEHITVFSEPPNVEPVGPVDRDSLGDLSRFLANHFPLQYTSDSPPLDADGHTYAAEVYETYADVLDGYAEENRRRADDAMAYTDQYTAEISRILAQLRDAYESGTLTAGEIEDLKERLRDLDKVIDSYVERARYLRWLADQQEALARFFRDVKAPDHREKAREKAEKERGVASVPERGGGRPASPSRPPTPTTPGQGEGAPAGGSGGAVPTDPGGENAPGNAPPAAPADPCAEVCGPCGCPCEGGGESGKKDGDGDGEAPPVPGPRPPEPTPPLPGPEDEGGGGEPPAGSGLGGGLPRPTGDPIGNIPGRGMDASGVQRSVNGGEAAPVGEEPNAGPDDEAEEEVSTADAPPPPEPRPVVRMAAGAGIPPPPAWARHAGIPLWMWIWFVRSVRFLIENPNADTTDFPPELKTLHRTLHNETGGGDSRYRLAVGDPRNPEAINPRLLEVLWKDLINYLVQSGRLELGDPDESLSVPTFEEMGFRDEFLPVASAGPEPGGTGEAHGPETPEPPPEAVARAITDLFTPEEMPKLRNEILDFAGSEEGVHVVLDVAGLLPGGVFADVANGLLYLLEGKFGDAALAFASAIPVAGTVIGLRKLYKMLQVYFKSERYRRRYPLLHRLFLRLRSVFDDAAKAGKEVAEDAVRAGEAVPVNGGDEAVSVVGKGSEGGSRGLPPPEQGPFDPRSVGAARLWTRTARLKEARLPTRGPWRYIPPKGYHPSRPLPRGPDHGYIDRFGNEWTWGRGTPRDPAGFEWDVQLGRKASPNFRAQSPDGRHVNVGVDGRITHGGR